MKAVLIIVLYLLPLAAFAQLTDPEIMDRKLGRYRPDSSFIYRLPYQSEKKFLFVQGANSTMSHRDELSFDFKMRTGTALFAAREGRVTEVREDSDKGGTKPEFLSLGNHVIIRHGDGSLAVYWHLQKNGVEVAEGDSVKQGQLIGYSGNTGYTAFPHLHFAVRAADGKELLPRFRTRRGVLYLRPGRWYQAVD